MTTLELWKGLGIIALCIIGFLVGVGLVTFLWYYFAENILEPLWEWIFSRAQEGTKEWVEDRLISIGLTLWLLLILYLMAG